MLFIKENLHNLYIRIINARRHVAYKENTKTATGRLRLWFLLLRFQLTKFEARSENLLAELASYVFVLRIVVGICTTREKSFA